MSLSNLDLKSAAIAVVVTLVSALVGGIVGYFLGSVALGAIILGVIGFYIITTDSSWVLKADPRTRGMNGGGGQGGV